MIKAIAGEKIEIGKAVYRGDDGKFYLATTKGYVGVAAEPISAGQEITDDNYSGHWRPVNKVTK